MSEPLSIQALGAGRVDLDPRQMRTSAPATAPTTGKSFADVFKETVGEVERLQNVADTTSKQLVSG